MTRLGNMTRATVRSGVVTLEGRLVATDLGRQIVRRVSHVPGVLAVRDRFSYHWPVICTRS